ncbi:hypothetical protein ABPG74_020507 [Tetrahymena malaccensis]
MKLQKQEDNLNEQDNLSKIEQIKNLNQKIEFLSIQNSENSLGQLKGKDSHQSEFDQEQPSTSTQQNDKSSSSDFLIVNGKLNLNRNIIQKQELNKLNVLQNDLEFPICDSQKNKKSQLDQNCKQGDQSFANLSQQQQQQNVKNQQQDDNVFEKFQELNKIQSDKMNQYNQEATNVENNQQHQKDQDIQYDILQKNDQFFNTQYQLTQYINIQQSLQQNNQKNNKSQFNGQSKPNRSFQIEDTWLNKYCQKIKVSDKQVFEIVALQNVICLSFFGNFVIAIEKKTFQQIYKLKGDPILYQGISFFCKSNQDEIIVRQDSLNGIDVWKINNFKQHKPVVKKLFQTSTSYQDQFHAMLVIKSQLMIYGNNQGTINIINLQSGKIVQNLNKIFKSQIINLSTSKKSKKNQQILIGADSKWNFKIFSLPYMQTITQFNVFNLGFTMPSFHQQLNIVKVLNSETVLISGSSKQAVIYDWKQSKTLKNISYQNSNFYSFINLSNQCSLLLIKQLYQQKTSFLITEWN